MLDPAELQKLHALSGKEAKKCATDLIERLARQVKFEQTKNQALSFELARLKQWRFGQSSESLNAASQGQLFDAKTEELLVQESNVEDRAADEARKPTSPKKQAKRQALPSQLQRIEHHYEIEPCCLSSGPPLKAHRPRGERTTGLRTGPCTPPHPGQIRLCLLAQVIIAKHDDHLALYRQEEIYRRSGAHIARSSMAQWIGQCGVRLEPLVQALKEHLLSQSVIHGDETPIKLLAPGTGKTRTAYAWVWRSSDLETTDKAVIYQFADGRAGTHASTMLQGYKGTLLTDHYVGYKALYAQGKVSEAGCWAHARCKFFEAHKLNQSTITQETLHRIAHLYELESQAQKMSQEDRHQLRQARSSPYLGEFKQWLIQHRLQLVKADVTARAIDYTLGRWAALTVYLSDAHIPIDNNAVENAIRPLALGRKNWLFVGSQQAGERSAVLMSLIESAKHQWA